MRLFRRTLNRTDRIKGFYVVSKNSIIYFCNHIQVKRAAYRGIPIFARIFVYLCICVCVAHPADQTKTERPEICKTFVIFLYFLKSDSDGQ